MQRGLAASDPALMRRLLASAGELRLVVLGTSMAPTIRPGDTVVIRPLAGALRVGDVLVYARSGQLWCHRVLVPGRSTITKGDNRGRPDAPVPAAAVIGRAVALQRGGRIVELHSLPSRLAGLAVNLAAPAAALGRRLARGVGVARAPGNPARHLLVAGFEIEVTGPRSALEALPAKRGRPSIRADFRISVELRQGATTGGRYGMVETGRRGRFRLTTPATVAHFDLGTRTCRAEMVAGAEPAALASILRVCGILLVSGPCGGLALHASAVRWGGKAYLFSGPGGSGKSTARELACQAGATSLADDLVLLRPDAHHDRWSAWGLPLESALIEPPPQDRRGTPVAALLVPAHGRSFDLHPLSPAGWTALAGTFPPPTGAPDFEDVLDRLADLAGSLPRHRMRFPNKPGALDELFKRLEAGG